MSYPPVLFLIIEGWRGEGRGEGGGLGERRTFLSCGQIVSCRVQPRTGTYIPIMQKWKMKKIINKFLASSLITQISYEAL